MKSWLMHVVTAGLELLLMFVVLLVIGFLGAKVSSYFDWNPGVVLITAVVSIISILVGTQSYIEQEKEGEKE